MFFQSPFHVGRLENDQVHGKTSRNLTANLKRLIDLISGRHDDQDVDVAVSVGRAVGIRAEQNDLFRPKALGDLAGEAADHAHGNIRTAIPAGKMILGKGWAFGLHHIIVPADKGSSPGGRFFTTETQRTQRKK